MYQKNLLTLHFEWPEAFVYIDMESGYSAWLEFITRGGTEELRRLMRHKTPAPFLRQWGQEPRAGVAAWIIA